MKFDLSPSIGVREISYNSFKAGESLLYLFIYLFIIVDSL
jgi:hypothetical protein